MAIKKTLAQNHLSELARKGRGGDTDLRFIDGELSHVDQGEASIVDMHGRPGEDVVKAFGSGTINPNTGLREYIIDPVTAITLGVGFIGGVTGASKKRASARLESRFLGEQIVEAEEAIGAASEKRTAETQVALAEYETAGESLGLSKSDAQKQLDEAIKKSNLVTSAGVTEKTSDVWKQFGIKAKGLFGQLGKTLGSVEEWFAGETSRLKGIVKQLTFQKELADKASKEKFLGIF